MGPHQMASSVMLVGYLSFMQNRPSNVTMDAIWCTLARVCKFVSHEVVAHSTASRWHSALAALEACASTGRGRYSRK